MEIKYAYINNICSTLKGKTEINFQNGVRDILRLYYKSFGFTYEVPDHHGGDKKNDGWVIEQAIFYQIYAPLAQMITKQKSFSKEINAKFEEDLTGLLNYIYCEERWGGTISEFIMIVNSMDQNLPEDSLRFYDTIVNEQKEKYSNITGERIEFSGTIKNVDYLEELLMEMEDINTLKNIHFKVCVSAPDILESITQKQIVETVNKINETLFESLILNNKQPIEFDKITLTKKININNLDLLKEDILATSRHLLTVEESIQIIQSQDIGYADSFNNIKEYIIDLYNEKENELYGIDLFDYLVDNLAELSGSTNKHACFLLILYVFEMCDIFIKEEELNDITR